MEQNEQRKVKREIAHKVTLENLKKFQFHQQSGWLPNYVEVYNKKISRVNIIATIILKPISENSQQNTIVIDDGTDQIEVRTFEQDFDFNKHNVGDIINLIGRIRVFNNNRYIVPEIIKQISNLKFLELRKKELEFEKRQYNQNIDLRKVKKEENHQEIKEVKIEKNKEDLVYNRIIKEIRRIDKGEGANIQEVLINTNLINKEELITELLEKGDIFEISPGKFKILE